MFSRKQQTVRSWAFVLAIVTALGFSAPGCSDDCPTKPDTTFRIAIDPSDLSVGVGEEFELRVRIDNASGLFGARCVVTFPQSLVQADTPAAEVGDLTSEDAVFLGVGGLGQVSIGVTEIQTSAVDGVSGSGLLATVRLRATTAGSGTFELTEVEMIDETGASLLAMDELAVEPAYFVVR